MFTDERTPIYSQQRRSREWVEYALDSALDLLDAMAEAVLEASPETDEHAYPGIGAFFGPGFSWTPYNPLADLFGVSEPDPARVEQWERMRQRLRGMGPSILLDDGFWPARSDD